MTDKSTALPSYMYGDPAKIMDGYRKQKEREEEWERRRFEIQRRKNRRKVQSLMRKVMKRR